MLHTRLLLFVFLGFLCLFTPSAHAEPFVALAAPFPPYSVSKGLQVQGISVTTLQTIMERSGSPITDRAIKLAPWAYAYERTACASQRILLNAIRTPQTEHLYKWVGPIATSRIVLMGRKKDRLFITLQSDLKKYRIATVRWSRSEKALLAGGIKATALHRSPTHVKALRQLANGEVDLFAFTEKGIPPLLKGLGMSQCAYTTYFTFGEYPLYFAFSKDTDNTLIQRLNSELKDFKATDSSGQSQFDRLLAQWWK
ncbi:transporter substrate-binding domain-containing protein [Pseudodesulfovibrio sp. JC047]|uniref:substrate-binding periplasmic protein n=1 Tax=Pseudodesulfovibrio sp. JC047 TaxID=2683199 RepID=UPI0013D51E7B|nr:transporter substrate-binding domain-containing protein [Pseudodesulfovibrio sp. JC047]NDV18998.1 transporter substrate-binding domain-containing protein [Pseudodesulfovibrio sp. JC047]